MQTVEDFKKDIETGGATLKSTFATLAVRAEASSMDRKLPMWSAYFRNRDLQQRFIEEIEHAISMPALAPEVLAMRYRLWQEFVASVETLNGTPSQKISTPEPEEEKEQDLTVYKDKHPTAPREDDLAVRKPQTLGVRIKPKPKFTKPAPTQKKVEVKKKEEKSKSPNVTPKKSEKSVEQKKAAKPIPQKPIQGGTAEKVRQSIIERVGKSSQGFLDGIFGSLGDDDAGLAKIEKMPLAEIIEIERLSPDAHTAKLDDFGITQKEWNGWIDWVNESNRVVPANVSMTLGAYVDQVARHIAQKK
ncbi:hypothetical protein KTR10_03195 [Candidatus Kaiserbacteria bacterium]|nr:hypothetical protein [Candidatus Kaiserbacteria bacterium]